MKGVTIINTYVKIWHKCPFWIIIFIFGTLLQYTMFKYMDLLTTFDIIWICVLANSGIIIFMLSTVINSPIYYDVKLDDSVILSDFQKKYKIISQSNDVYTVMEISNSEGDI